MGDKVSQLIERILCLYSQLHQDDKLKTSNDVYSKVYKNLEDLVDDDAETTQAVLSDPRVLSIMPDLRKGYLQCVYDLEKEFVQRLVLHPEDILLYPKFEQYRWRAFFEYYLFSVFFNINLNNVLFVGSGPLPLSSILMTRYFGVQVDYLDRQQEAIELASLLIEKMNLMGHSKFYCSDILDFYEIEKYTAIFIAGSVGDDENHKSLLLQHFKKHMKSGQYLLLRPPYLLEKLLVSSFDLADFSPFRVYTATIISEYDIIYRCILQKI